MNIREVEYRSIDTCHAEVLVDGKVIHGVQSFNFDHMSPDELPCATITLSPFRTSIKQLADLQVCLDISCVDAAETAIKFLSALNEDYLQKIQTKIYDILCELTEHEKHGHLSDYERARFITKRILE